MTICSVHTIIRWLKESRSAWVWSSSSSETYMHFPRTQWNPRCCTSWTSSLSLYKHYAWPVFGKSLFMIIMCKDAWLCRITAISKYPGIGPLDLNSHQTFFFLFLHLPTTYWDCLFLQNVDLVPLHTRWRTHVADFWFLCSSFHAFLMEKEKPRTILFCAKGCYNFISHFKQGINKHQ